MEINYDAIKFITGFDLSSSESVKRCGIESASIMSSEGWTTKLMIRRYGSDIDEFFPLDYEPYYQHIRILKLQKIIDNIKK